MARFNSSEYSYAALKAFVLKYTGVNGTSVMRFLFSLTIYMLLFVDVNTTETSDELEDQDYFGTLSNKPTVVREVIVLKKSIFNHSVGLCSHIIFVQKRDLYLIAAWLFIIAAGSYYTSRLPIIQRLFDLLARNWREANEEN